MNARTRTYRGYTLAEAQEELRVWKTAKRYAAVGKSYSIGTRSLTRYDLDEINREIAFFSDIVGTLEGGARGPVRVQGVVVR